MEPKRYRVSFDLLLSDTNENDVANWICNEMANSLDIGEDIEELDVTEVLPPDIEYPSGESNCQYGDKG